MTGDTFPERCPGCAAPIRLAPNESWGLGQYACGRHVTTGELPSEAAKAACAEIAKLRKQRDNTMQRWHEANERCIRRSERNEALSIVLRATNDLIAAYGTMPDEFGWATMTEQTRINEKVLKASNRGVCAACGSGFVPGILGASQVFCSVDCSQKGARPMRQIWAGECEACEQARERGYRLCDDHEDGEPDVG